MAQSESSGVCNDVEALEARFNVQNKCFEYAMHTFTYYIVHNCYIATVFFPLLKQSKLKNNLLVVHNIELLMQAKINKLFKRIKVTLLTTLFAGADMLKSYPDYINRYISRATGLSALINVVATIVQFWVMLMQLPVKKLSYAI